MSMKKTTFLPLLTGLALLSPGNTMAAGFLNLGGGPASAVGGIFGGGGPPPATLPAQMTQLTELYAMVDQGLKNLQHMPASMTGGVISDVNALLAELARMSGSFETIYDDPATATTHEKAEAYKQMQLNRQLARLEEMAGTMRVLEAKAKATAAASAQLPALNRSATGAVSAIQANTEAQMLGLSYDQQQVQVGTEIWRSLAQGENRIAEDQALARARNCGFWGPDFTDECEK